MNLKNRQVDFWLVMTILILLGLGTMMVFSSSSAASYVKFDSSFSLLLKQLVWVGLGLIVMLFVSKIDYHFIGKYSLQLFAGAIVLLVLVLIPGVGKSFNNARRWLGFGGLTFQPSEFIKLGMVLLFAYLLSNTRYVKKMAGLKGFFIMLGIIGGVAGLLFLQPHVSCIIIIGMVSVIMMFVAGVKLRYFLVLGGVGVAGAVVAFISLNHVRERVMAFTDPFAHASDEGYQVVQSLLAIGSGGFTGKGLGQSVQKYLYLPEPYNDFIFSILAEEMGFIGVFIVLALYCVFIWRGYKIAISAPDKFGCLVATGITTLIAVQVLMNIAVVTSSIPVTGVSLPFFSYGGTSLVIMMINMGILLNISKEANYNKF